MSPDNKPSEETRGPVATTSDCRCAYRLVTASLVIVTSLYFLGAAGELATALVEIAHKDSTNAASRVIRHGLLYLFVCTLCGAAFFARARHFRYADALTFSAAGFVGAVSISTIAHSLSTGFSVYDFVEPAIVLPCVLLMLVFSGKSMQREINKRQDHEHARS